MLTYITIFATVASFLLGMYTLRFRKNALENQYFAALCFSIALWLVVMAQSIASPSLFWIRASMVLAAIMILVLFLFTYYFVTPKPRRAIVTVVYALGICAIALAASPLVFHSVAIEGTNAYPVVGYGMFFFAPYSFIGLLSACGLLVRVMFREPERTMIRVQVEWITVGLIGTVSLMIFFGFVVVNVWHTDRYLPIAMLSTMLFVGCAAYAMTRYRFLDVRVLFTKSLLYAAFIGLLASVYTAMVLKVYYELQTVANIDPIVWLIASLLIFVVVFEAVHRRVKTFLDGKFILDVIDFTNIIHEHQQVLNTSHELQSYVLELVGRIQRLTHVDVQQVFIHQRQYKRFKSFYPLRSRQYLLFSDEIISELAEKKFRGVHLVSESNKKGASTRLQKFFRKNHAQGYMTIDGPEKEILAIVLLGKHKNNLDIESYHLERLAAVREEAGEMLHGIVGMQMSLEGAKITLLQQ